MLKVFVEAFFVLFVFSNLFSQTISNEFINALIFDNSGLTDYIDKIELERSGALGIIYDDVKYKCLISFDIPDNIKQVFREGSHNHTVQTQVLEDGFSVVTLAAGSMNYLQKFYFLNGKFVHPSVYFARNWQSKESKYFRFRISKPEYFNDYCIKRLDDYVDSLCVLLEVEPERRKILENEKILYTLCSEENEVERITGYKSKGMSVLAFDEVITAYQTHFHEIAHLLINFKLRNLGLYTLPIMMEGFAVAVGGRGGMAPRVVTDLGYFLQKTGFLTYDSILTYESFYSQDANMTYAVSGLYNKFLLEALGGKQYLEMYKTSNGNLEFVKNISVPGLPSDEKFNAYLLNYTDDSLMTAGENDADNYYCLLYGSPENFKSINCENTVNLSNYSSRLFTEAVSGIYTGEHYLIIVKPSSVKLVDCYNDEIIYSYEKNFSLNPYIFNPGMKICFKRLLFNCTPVN